jgi:hypothetical protein
MDAMDGDQHIESCPPELERASQIDYIDELL